MSSALSEAPAASSCPPKAVSTSLHADSASNSEKPRMLRPEPRAVPSPRTDRTMHGLPKRSSRRAAMMPTTPGCQFSPSTTSTRSSRRSGSFSSLPKISAKIAASTVWRCTLRACTSSASGAASPSLPHSSSRAAYSGDAMRPDALIRGARVNTVPVAVSALPPAPATSASARRPGRSRRLIFSSPRRTSTRLAPLSDTTSARVPSATRSAYSSSTVSMSPSSAQASRNATPTPAYSLKVLSQSARCGSTTATARGSTSCGWWWSVTTTSMPFSRAYATSSAAAIPLSTVIISFAPSSASRSMVGR